MRGQPITCSLHCWANLDLIELQVSNWLRQRGAAIQHMTLSRGTKFHVAPPAGPLHARRLCLEDLARFIGFHPEPHLAFVNSVPRLEALRLGSVSIGATETTLEQLQHLQPLTSLSLNTSSMDAPVQLSRFLSCLTRLRRLRLGCARITCTSAAEAHLVHTVSKLTALTCLDLKGMLSSVPPELSALDQLEVLCVRDTCHMDSLFTISPAIESCTRLECLILDGIGPSTKGGWQNVWDALLLLPRLQHLILKGVDTQHVDAWCLPSRLTALELYGNFMNELPPGICNLPLLQRLIVTCGPELPNLYPYSSKLQQIPNGPYLRNLQQLVIDCPFPTADASVLADAKNLTRISIQYRHDMYPPWTRRGLQAVLPKDCRIELLNEPKGIWVVRRPENAFVPALMSQWHEDTAEWSERAVKLVKWLVSCFATRA